MERKDDVAVDTEMCNLVIRAYAKVLSLIVSLSSPLSALGLGKITGESVGFPESNVGFKAFDGRAGHTWRGRVE